MINHHQDDWINLLPFSNFVSNNTYHSSLGHIPFFANYGHHPWFNILAMGRMNNLAIEDFIKRLLTFEAI
jgi:hypothetical protein